MKILVTGGAGYIGSFMVKRLLKNGDDVVVLDSLERGQREAIDTKAKFVQGDLLNPEILENTFSTDKFDAVIHFAGYISMAESMENPKLYFQNNTLGSLNLIEQAVRHNIKSLVFSSTAGVYGNPIKTPISEDHQTLPTNPYGESKLMVEKILAWYNKIFGLSFASLRYFNAAGASLDGNMGEDHDPETHIIPLAIKATLGNSEFSLFGNDYDTPDGTCIRDYIHVIDLVESHLLTLQKLKENPDDYYYNVGTGKGYSNKEVLEMVKKISGIDFKVKNSSRRSGDVDVLIADPTKIKKELGFEPKYSDLETIVKTAWEWRKNNSKFKIQNSK
ncbi:MAG: UDP-glucose 4-epimerase GalE [Candidatus Levybacteria bacterium]|nr:UDP-glucose 4-epimerase GalE [Candidatus Levybacteria bacterium]